MTAHWFIVLEVARGEPGRRVGGLPIALRLALDAQRAGAGGVICAEPRARALLDDPRLQIAVTSDPPSGARLVRVPADTIVHPATFTAIAASPRSEWDLAAEAPKLEGPHVFDPVPVRDAASAGRALSLLLRSLRKPQDGWTSRWLNRYVSLGVTRLLVHTPLRPNQISLVILCIGLAGAVIAARGDYWAGVAGAFLFQMQSVLDGCDGELSRITHRRSLTGEWLDTIGDDLTNYSFFAGAAWGAYSSTHWGGYVVVGAVIVACGLTTSAVEYRYLVSIGSGDLLRYPITVQSGQQNRVIAAIQPLFKRDTFVLLTFVAALAGALGPMLVVFALGAVGILFNVFQAELRMLRERRTARNGSTP